MELKSIITISGRICSGKSYAANLIKNTFGFPIASFGGYLKYYCEQNSLTTDRKTLQDTGEEFVKDNPKQFLIDVIAHFIGIEEIIILEGVRHKSILDEADQISKNHLAVFIDTDLETRYQRYYNRNKDLDSLKTYEQFIVIDNHPVESEIEKLKNYCDIILIGNNDYSKKIETVINKLLLTR